MNCPTFNVQERYSAACRQGIEQRRLWAVFSSTTTKIAVKGSIALTQSYGTEFHCHCGCARALRHVYHTATGQTALCCDEECHPAHEEIALSRRALCYEERCAVKRRQPLRRCWWRRSHGVPPLWPGTAKPSPSRSMHALRSLQRSTTDASAAQLLCSAPPSRRRSQRCWSRRGCGVVLQSLSAALHVQCRHCGASVQRYTFKTSDVLPPCTAPPSR